MAEQSTLPPHWAVPQEFRNRVGKQAGRQRPMLSERHLLLILHRPPGPEDVEREGRYFWRQPDGSWSSNKLGNGPQALNRHLDEYAEAVEKCDRQEEAAVAAADHFGVLSRLAPIHRSARHMHQTLQEARKMVPQDRELIAFRDRAYEIERTAELLYSESRNSLDFAIAQRGEEQAESSHRMALSSHRLNLLAAFFFPIATLGALFGVNLVHGFETAASPMPFLSVLCLGLLLGYVLISFVTEDPHKRAARKSLWDRLQGAGPRRPDQTENVPLDSDRYSMRR